MLNSQNESGPRMDIVIDASPCKKHKASKGEPCWTLHVTSAGQSVGRAVCGVRTKTAGFATPASNETQSNTPSGKIPSKPPYHRHKATKKGRPRPTKAPSTSPQAKDNS